MGEGGSWRNALLVFHRAGAVWGTSVVHTGLTLGGGT